MKYAEPLCISEAKLIALLFDLARARVYPSFGLYQRYPVMVIDAKTAQQV